MALQQTLGLLPQRRPGSASFDIDYFDAARPYLVSVNEAEEGKFNEQVELLEQQGVFLIMSINADVLQGKWKQLKGQVQQKWGELTDNDLNKIEGRYEELVGLVQEKYGRTRAEAEQEVRDFIDNLS